MSDVSHTDKVAGMFARMVGASSDGATVINPKNLYGIKPSEWIEPTADEVEQSVAGTVILCSPVGKEKYFFDFIRLLAKSTTSKEEANVRPSRNYEVTDLIGAAVLRGMVESAVYERKDSSQITLQLGDRERRSALIFYYSRLSPSSIPTDDVMSISEPELNRLITIAFQEAASEGISEPTNGSKNWLNDIGQRHC